MGIKFGTCISYGDAVNLSCAKALGYDYIETAISAFNDASDAQIEEFCANLINYDITCEAVNVLFGGDVKIIGENADFTQADEYLHRLFERTKKIGYKIVVFGSGRVRRYENGFPKEKAMEQVICVCRDVIKKYADKYGFALAVEELNQGETNLINTLSEAEYVASNAGCGVIADYYHVALEKDNIRNMKNPKIIIHTHTSNVPQRRYPKKTDAPEDIAGFLDFCDSLKACGYNARMSIEAGYDGDFGEASADSLEYLRECWEK